MTIFEINIIIILICQNFCLLHTTRQHRLLMKRKIKGYCYCKLVNYININLHVRSILPHAYDLLCLISSAHV